MWKGKENHTRRGRDPVEKNCNTAGSIMALFIYLSFPAISSNPAYPAVDLPVYKQCIELLASSRTIAYDTHSPIDTICNPQSNPSISIHKKRFFFPSPKPNQSLLHPLSLSSVKVLCLLPSQLRRWQRRFLLWCDTVLSLNGMRLLLFIIEGEIVERTGRDGR